MAAAVIPHGYPAPVLDAIEHDLDLVALFIEGFAVTQPVLPVLARRDAGGDTPFFQRRPEPVGVMPRSAISSFAFGRRCRRVLARGYAEVR